MSQSRFWIADYPTYGEAAIGKSDLEEKNPEAVYQIRKGKTGNGKQVFRVVERFKSNEVRVIQNSKGKKKRKQRVENFDWLTS